LLSFCSPVVKIPIYVNMLPIFFAAFGETGLGEIGLGEIGLGETGLGETGQGRLRQGRRQC
jgi:hypothetical protein